MGNPYPDLDWAMHAGLPPWDAVRRRSSRNVRARVAVLAGVVVLIAVAAALVLRGDAPAIPGRRPSPRRPRASRTRPAARSRTRSPTTPDREDDFVARAAQGAAHVLYARVAGRRARDRGAGRALAPAGRARRAQAKVDPDLLEALVFLESAGRDGRDARATPRAPSG